MGIKTCEEEHYSLLQIVVNVYIAPIFCVIGFVENLLMILILKKNKRSGKTTSFMLQMIALADIFYLFSSLLILTFDTVAEKMEVGQKYIKPTVWPYFEPYVWPIASVFQTVTVWLVVLMTGDRFLAVCYPMKAMRYTTISFMRKLTVAIWILSCLYNLPRFFEQKIVITQNSTKAEDWISSDTNYIIVYQNTSYFVLRFVMPFTLLIVFNVRILRAIKKSFSFREQMTIKSGSGQKDNFTNISANHSTDAASMENGKPVLKKSSSVSSSALGNQKEKDKNKAATNHHTLTLVIAVSLYVVCEIPDKIYRILSAIYFSSDGEILELEVLGNINVISNFLLTVNSMTNFVVYCLMLKWFRRALKGLFCKVKEEEDLNMSRTRDESFTISKSISMTSVNSRI